MSLFSFSDQQVGDINQKIFNDPIEFARLILGIKLHPGQQKWVKNSTKRINILRPGNRWGKTLVAGVKHNWHCMCKPKLANRVMTHEEWLRLEYQTLNFGPTYELGRGALQVARDMAQGNLLIYVCPKCDSIDIDLLPDYSYTCLSCRTMFKRPASRLNKSLLQDWAITADHSDSAQMPYLEYRTGSRLLGRSYSEMGKAFKMKALAYVSGDECGDIGELWTFTNNTLLPRVVDLDGNIDLVGTPQPEGMEYMSMIEMAEEDMKTPDYKTRGLFYTQRGRMYDNTNLPRAAIEEIERIADPAMREQIIEGNYVEAGEKYFGFERVRNAIDKNLNLQDRGYEGRKYLTIADYAGGESAWADYTVIATIDYTEEPYRVVQFQRFKGGDISIPMQYKLTEEIVLVFGGKGTLAIDSSSLGGKNAMAFLRHLMPISVEFGPGRGGILKAEMLATLKIAFDGGQSEARRRERERDSEGTWRDKNPDWGLIRIPNIPVLIGELQNYKLDDAKIRQDCVMVLAMGVHWIMMRRPKRQPQSAVELDFLAA